MQFKYKKPSPCYELDIKQSRHPVIEQNLPAGESYITNDIFLDTNRSKSLFLLVPI